MSGLWVTVAKSSRATESCQSLPQSQVHSRLSFLRLLLCVIARSISSPPPHSCPSACSLCWVTSVSCLLLIWPGLHTVLGRELLFSASCMGEIYQLHISPELEGFCFLCQLCWWWFSSSSAKRAPLKVYSLCFLGTEKIVMVLWFIFLIWKQNSILWKAITSDLEKKTCYLLSPVLQLYVLFVGNRVSER